MAQTRITQSQGNSSETAKTARQQTSDFDFPSGIDLAEKGRLEIGQLIQLDRRLFMQFQAFGNCINRDALIHAARERSLRVVIYADAHDPQGVGILSFSEHPDYFLDEVHGWLASCVAQGMVQKPEFTMLGRTYALGYEPDLQETLLTRPVARVCNASTPWAIWYPVRRTGSFLQQPREEQRRMLMEHGGIGHAYGKANLATDIRLACHGLCKEDMDFIVGLLGRELFPLSALVAHMRQTRQTAEFIERMGPFFVGRVIYQSDERNYIKELTHDVAD